MKQLLRELGRAINEAVSDSERLTDAIAAIKANGYDVFLMLDAVVGLSRRSPDADEALAITSQDHRFLKSLKIRLDDEAPPATPPGATNTRLTITPQDIKFLKSLRINVDDLD
jgi:hypothetical protein